MPLPPASNVFIGFDSFCGGLIKCQGFALVKAAASGSSEKMEHLTTIGIFAVLSARMPTSEKECRRSAGGPNRVPVLCAVTGFRSSRQMPLCRVTVRPERLGRSPRRFGHKTGVQQSSAAGDMESGMTLLPNCASKTLPTEMSGRLRGSIFSLAGAQ